jgi:hypothetical protein
MTNELATTSTKGAKDLFLDTNLQLYKIGKKINWEDVFWAWLECCSCYKSYFAQCWPQQARSRADRHDNLFPSLTSMYQKDQINFIEQSKQDAGLG